MSGRRPRISVRTGFLRDCDFDDRKGWLSPRDEQRFRELYDRTYTRVWAFVLRRLPDEDAAKDAVAETFLVTWRRLPEVPAEPRMAEAWVFAAARRVLSNSRRAMRRRSRLVDRLRQRPVDVAIDISAADESNVQVMRALELLRPAQREILALAFWEELDTEQVAHLLGCSKNAAAIRLTRARRALHDAFESLPPNRSVDGLEPDRRGGER
jgi:RNA polymerase sigma-70 factor (ECF subfamily)